jgi:hypothetical protein
VAPLSAIPPADRPGGWAVIVWADVRTALEHGKAVCFQVRRDQVVPFWQLAQAQLGRPIRVRYLARHEAFWVYPLADARPFRARASQATAPEDLAYMVDQAWQLRSRATAAFIVADSIEHAAQEMQRGLDRTQADALFVCERGDGGFYPLWFDHAMFRTWVDGLRAADPELASVLPPAARAEGAEAQACEGSGKGLR